MQRQAWYKVNAPDVRTSPIHEYFGFTGTRYLGVQEHDDHLSLVHIFGGIVGFWRFTYDGRIRNMGFNVKEENWYHHALTLKKTDVVMGWTQGFADYNFLPERAALIQQDLVFMHPLDQYNNLITRAREDASKVLQSFSQHDAATQRKPQQLPLAAIGQNSRLHGALLLVSRLEPELKVMNKFELNIRYLRSD